MFVALSLRAKKCLTGKTSLVRLASRCLTLPNEKGHVLRPLTANSSIRLRRKFWFSNTSTNSSDDSMAQAPSTTSTNSVSWVAAELPRRMWASSGTGKSRLQEYLLQIHTQSAGLAALPLLREALSFTRDRGLLALDRKHCAMKWITALAWHSRDPESLELLSSLLNRDDLRVRTWMYATKRNLVRSIRGSPPRRARSSTPLGPKTTRPPDLARERPLGLGRRNRPERQGFTIWNSLSRTFLGRFR